MGALPARLPRVPQAVAARSILQIRGLERQRPPSPAPTIQFSFSFDYELVLDYLYSYSYSEQWDFLAAVADGEPEIVVTGDVELYSQVTVDFSARISSDTGDRAIDGRASTRLFYVTGELTLDGLVLRNGLADGTSSPSTHGGAAYVASGGSLELRNCTLVSNRAWNSGGLARGGGIYAVGGLIE